MVRRAQKSADDYMDDTEDRKSRIIGMAQRTSEAGCLGWHSIEYRMVAMAQKTAEARCGAMAQRTAEDCRDGTEDSSGW